MPICEGTREEILTNIDPFANDAAGVNETKVALAEEILDPTLKEIFVLRAQCDVERLSFHTQHYGHSADCSTWSGEHSRSRNCH